jgi:Mn2+/Fe2+ NRAMP family transporter
MTVPTESTSVNRDPYKLHESTVREPPSSLRESLRYLGPGFILSASIVGSGELIATTLVGAKAGFVLMWFLIFSCLVKVAVQIEFGKHAISSGETTMASLNTIPGPRFGSANWSIWTWLVLMLVKMLQVGGVLGGVVLAIEQFAPSLNQMPARAVVSYGLAVSVSLLVFRGYYRHVEKASLLMIGAFTLFTFASVCALQTTPFAISIQEFVSGLIPSLPTESAVLLAAVGAFGITGVGGDEIMAYNYWLLEKGYAAYTGPKNDSADWERRAKGWIRVMYLDATLAMVAYTTMTVMFYLLGAAVLHRQNLVPAEGDLIQTLGSMYTDSLGPWARSLYLIGAIVVLYSTLFAALAAWTRMFSDAFARVGMFDFDHEPTRRKSIAILAWAIPMIWGTLFLFMGKPGLMVLLGGLATVVILLVVVFAALFFRYRRLDRRLTPTRLYDICLWISSVSILGVAVYVSWDTITKLMG